MPKVGDTIPAHVTLGKSKLDKALENLRKEINEAEKEVKNVSA